MAASEPPEEAIANFISFTSTSREQAVAFLKANELDSQRAINAYFEDPTGPQTEESNYYAAQNVASYRNEHEKPSQRPSLVAPPSRPPSRMDTHDSPPAAKFEGAPAPATTADTEKGLSLAEREERDLQQAMAMSLNQDLGEQETGVTSTNQTRFGRATRNEYNDNEWAMTLFNASACEIVISPDPEDRKRVTGEPAFLRPTQEGLYLGGLLTILHSIPLAREAFFLRDRVLSDYGHDPQWWNGQPIHLPKIVTVHDSHGLDSDWDDIIHECQRLMAFLDLTNRAFGTADALASLRSVSSYDPEGVIGMFLENWQRAAVTAAPENQLATMFSSRAFQKPLSVYDTPVDKEFVTLDPSVVPEHGQTLYDVLDHTLWTEKPGEDLDDVWLGDCAEVLTIKLENSDTSAWSVDVKVPAVFYADRYMESCRDLSREFRTRRLQIYEEVSKLESLMNRFSFSRAVAQKGLTSKEALENAAASVSFSLRRDSVGNGSGNPITPDSTSADGQRLANELRRISRQIEEKLKELELRKSKALEALRNYSKFLTEPPASPTEAPHYRYTLRGVCTEPHVTYVLRRAVPDNNASAMSTGSTADNGWQWWRISFSTDDAKTRRAETNANNARQSEYAASQNADIVGYTAHKVREIEVLRAARFESRTVLLVYASSRAMSAPEIPAPAPLQDFVIKDNAAFEEEFRGSEINHNAGEQADDYGSPVQTNVYLDTHAQSNPSSEQQKEIKDESAYPSTDSPGDGGFPLNKEEVLHQEMQERAGSNLLNQSKTSNTVDAPSYLGPNWEDPHADDHVSHVEHRQ